MNVHVDIDEAKGNALIVAPSVETAMDVFKEPSGIDPFLAMIRKHVAEFTPDVTTAKGRKEIASIAAKVSRSKTLLDDVGKTLVADLKDLPKRIDATRKIWRDTMDQIKDEVRRPLTEWEEAEDARVAKHESAIKALEDLAAGRVSGTVPPRVEDYDRALTDLDKFGPGNDGKDFEDAYRRLKDRASETLTGLRNAAVKAATEAAELEALRKEKAEREAKERAEAESRAAAERQRIAEEQAAERARIAAEEAAQREQRAAAEREAALQRQAEEAKRQAAEAERRAQEAEARAAAEAERKQREAAEAEAAATAARERDKAHRKAINNAAKDALVTGGLAPDAAELAVTMIAKGMIPGVSIRY